MIFAFLVLFYSTKIRVNGKDEITGNSLLEAVTKSNYNFADAKQIEFLEGSITQEEMTNQVIRDSFKSVELFNASEDVFVEAKTIPNNSFFALDSVRFINMKCDIEEIGYAAFMMCKRY